MLSARVHICSTKPVSALCLFFLKRADAVFSSSGVGRMSDKRDCYVIMPFSSTSLCTSEQWTEIYEEVFKPAVLDCNYTCERAQPGTGSLSRSIVEKLRSSFLVVADITDRNANVFYELGVRHALSKRTIIVSHAGQGMPSDLGGYWHIQYGISPRQVSAFKAEIRRLIDAIANNPERSDNPVSDYLEGENISINRSLNFENLKKLSALYTELSGTALILDDCLLAAGELLDRTATLLSTGCLDLLLQTLYIDPGPTRLGEFYEFRQDIQLIKSRYADVARIRKARRSASQLSDVIIDTRARLIKGQLEEPDTVSVMVWKPSPALALDESNLNKMPNSVYACPHDAASRFSSADRTLLSRITSGQLTPPNDSARSGREKNADPESTRDSQ
jgi:hypothetical protein